MRINRLLAAAVSTWALSLASAPPAHAEAIWAIAGKEVLRLHATVGRLTPEKRAEMLDARVTEILSKGDGTLSASDIVIRETPSTVMIVVRGDTLVTVMAEDAAAHQMTRGKLARTWLTAIRNTLPQLAPRVNHRGA